MKIAVRLATPEDRPAIEKLWDEQEKRLGCKVDRPDLFDKPILAAIVIEKNGRIIDAGYLEAVAEFCMCGCDARGTVALRKASPGLLWFLRKRGFRRVRTFIPNDIAEILEKPIANAGLVREDSLAHFTLNLTKIPTEGVEAESEATHGA